MSISVNLQARSLQKNGINDTLCDIYKKVKADCKELANKIKEKKLKLSILKDKAAAKQYRYASGEPKGFFKRMATKREIRIMENKAKLEKMKIKRLKTAYKKLKTRRKAIVQEIRNQYKDNKKYIKYNKTEKRRRALAKMGLYKTTPENDYQQEDARDYTPDFTQQSQPFSQDTPYDEDKTR